MQIRHFGTTLGVLLKVSGHVRADQLVASLDNYVF